MYVDLLYGVELILNFFTAFEDQEKDIKYFLKQIALNQIKSYQFWLELLATIPFGPIYIASTDSPNLDFVQDILVLKLLRLYRFTADTSFETQLTE